jgi:hypothetical protein
MTANLLVDYLQCKCTVHIIIYNADISEMEIIKDVLQVSLIVYSN